MAKRGNELHLEDLLGRRVRDQDGRVLGRLEEFRAHREGDYWVVAEYDIGPTALLERLAVRHVGLAWPGRVHGYRATWDQIDVSDPKRLMLTCGVDELKKLG